jgi:hypothetical protein
MQDIIDRICARISRDYQTLLSIRRDMPAEWTAESEAKLRTLHEMVACLGIETNPAQPDSRLLSVERH